MKFLYATFLLFLVGCGRESPVRSPAPEAARVPAPSILEISDESRLLRLTSALLESGRNLPPGDAEHCWRRRENEALRASCILLWARGKRRDPRLESELRGHLGRPYVATAVVLHGELLKEWDSAALFTALDALREAPVWLRARAIGQWVEKRDIPLPLARELMDKLALEEAESPLDLEESWKVLGRLSPGTRELFLRDHCSHLLHGENWVRCWRFLAAVKPALDAALLDALVGTRQRSDWLYFERNLPHFAKLLLP